MHFCHFRIFKHENKQNYNEQIETGPKDFSCISGAEGWSGEVLGAGGRSGGSGAGGWSRGSDAGGWSEGPLIIEKIESTCPDFISKSLILNWCACSVNRRYAIL